MRFLGNGWQPRPAASIYYLDTTFSTIARKQNIIASPAVQTDQAILTHLEGCITIVLRSFVVSRSIQYGNPLLVN